MKTLIKSLICVTVLVAGFSAQAAQPKFKNISQEQFLTEVGQYFSNMTGTFPAAFNGELEDIGGECTVGLVHDENGHNQILLQGESTIRLAASFDQDSAVKVSVEGEADGSFQKTYVFGFMGLYKMKITHVDDAYDTVSLSNGITTLQCGAYY